MNWHGNIIRFLRGLSAAGLLCVILAGCTGRDSEQSTVRVPVQVDSLTGAFRFYEGDREVVDSLRVDVGGGGVEHLVVASRPLDGADAMLTADRFDMIEIFLADSSGHPRSVFVDAVEGGESLRAEDLTADGNLELLVTLHAGGNDPITSLGLNIYGVNGDGVFVPMFVSPAGAPELRDLDGDGRREILLSDVLYGMMAHSDAVGYTEGVYAFDGAAWVRANDAFRSYFTGQTSARRTAYMKLKRGGPGRGFTETLHTRFMDWLAWAFASGSVHEARTVLEAERGYLEAQLSPEQMEGLDALVDELEILSQRQMRDGAL